MNVKLKMYEVLHGLPEGTEMLVRLEDIIVPDVFRLRSSKPKYWKMLRARNAYEDNGFIDKPLTVEVITNEYGKPTKYLLVDGYTRYLVLSECRVVKAPVKYIVVNG